MINMGKLPLVQSHLTVSKKKAQKSLLFADGRSFESKSDAIYIPDEAFTNSKLWSRFSSAHLRYKHNPNNFIQC